MQASGAEERTEQEAAASSLLPADTLAVQTAKLRRSQRALRRQTERFTAAIENMAHGFSMYDPRGRLVA